MDMGTNFLASFSGPKNAYNRYFDRILLLRLYSWPRELGIKFCGCCLVVIHAIESDPEETHKDLEKVQFKQPSKSMVIMGVVSKRSRSECQSGYESKNILSKARFENKSAYPRSALSLHPGFALHHSHRLAVERSSSATYC